MEASELGELNNDIKDCLCCGKCKPVCTTHVPRANLLYSPRNKTLATGLMIEVILYEDQTRRGISLRHFEEMNDIADHFTICHKCLKPCLVNIDFGDVTIRVRRILKDRGQRRTNLISTLSMTFLNIKDPTTIRAMRKVMIQWSYKGQRFRHTVFRRLGLLQDKRRPQASTGIASLPIQVINFVKQPMPGHPLHPDTTARPPEFDTFASNWVFFRLVVQ